MFAGSVYQGMQEKKLKNEEAVGYRAAATRRFAAATHEHREEERNAEFIYSSALAAAAASGTAAGDVGVSNLLADLSAEGQYRALSRLWQGRDEAQGLEHRARQSIKAGKAALNASVIQGVVSGAQAYTGFGKTAGAPTSSGGVRGVPAGSKAGLRTKYK